MLQVKLEPNARVIGLNTLFANGLISPPHFDELLEQIISLKSTSLLVCKPQQ